MSMQTKRVAIVDDERKSAEWAADIAEEAGMNPTIFSEGQGPFGKVSELISLIKQSQCDVVISDHRLSDTPFASFSGAQLVSGLFLQGVPGLLLSTYSSIDGATSIRLHRAHIPSVISREDFDPERILRGLSLCEKELAGGISPERLPRRTLVRVVSVTTESDAPVVDAIVHTWNPDKAIRFPLMIVTDPLIRAALPPGFRGELRLFAEVNVGCSDEKDLFFRNFELAPELKDDEFAT